ncbi:hypothetical protein EBB07_28805 [Paenibacillaceae bacterium]|nr:hypothetical protein EBB07_28805 [Paenibacillaceae bacterium]
MSTEFGFIVDTNKYTEFRHRMCAYMTGHTPTNTSDGEDERVEYLEYHKKLDGVLFKRDLLDISSPSNVYPTNDIWNNGYGHYYTKDTEKKALEHYKSSVIELYLEFINEYIKLDRSLYSDTFINSKITECKKEINKAKNATCINKYPAYLSFIIYFNHIPSNKTLSFLKKRAIEFTNKYEKNVEVTGFRILKPEPI